MGIINNLEGSNIALFQGIANRKNYFEVRIKDSTSFFDNPLKINFITQETTPDGFVDIGDQNYENNKSNSGVHSDNIPGDERSGFQSFNIGSDTDFDFRLRFKEMSVPNECGDNTCAIVFGLITQRDFPKDGGGFFGKVDSPANGLRRFSIMFARSGLDSSQDVTVFTKTESFSGEFGESSIVANNIAGKVIQSIRFCRSGNKLLAEWNYWSDQTNEGVGLDYQGTFTKTYRNRREFYPDNGYNLNNGSAEIFNDDIKIQVYARMDNDAAGFVGSDFTIYVGTMFIEHVPAVCLDTTHSSESVDVLSYGGNLLKFQNKGHSEGFSDIRITHIPNDGEGNILKVTQSGNIFRFSRNEIITGNTHQFLYDNKLINVKTNDLHRDIIIDNLNRSSNNLGNAYPILSTTLPRSRVDGTFFIHINKEGILEQLQLNDDSTEYSLSIDPANVVKNKNIINLGRNGLPTYLFNDQTYYLGRTARFDIMDVLKVEYQIGQTSIPDQYKVFELDSTSYYVSEVVSDGTYFIAYSRTYNLINKSLSARSRINTDITILNINPTYSPTGTQYPGLTFRYYKPNVDIMVFPDKHICAITANGFGASPFNGTPGYGFRLFYESFDRGATWEFKDKSTRNYGHAGEEDYKGSTHTFKIRNNDDYFFNFYVDGAAIRGQYVRKDNFSTKPTNSFLNNFMKYSKFSSDQTVRYIHGCFDPIQKQIKITVASLNGYFEILKSPKLQGNALKGFDNLYSDNAWQSEFYSNAFSGPSSAKVLSSCDSNGDLISIASKINDSTSFAIFRTSSAKDDLNYMGRFIQSGNQDATRKDMYINNMFQDYYGNLIFGSCILDSTNVVMALHKYGQYSNEPTELDFDESYIYPQHLYTSGSATVASDTTINGYVLGGVITSIIGFNEYGSGSLRSLENTVLRGGFKSEWRSFTDPVTTDTTSTAFRMNFQMLGRKLSTTAYEAVSISLGWDTSNVWAIDQINSVRKDRKPLNGREFRRYMFCAERTTDNSARCILFTENLNLSNYDKIIWDRKLSFIVPFTSSALFSDTVVAFPGTLSQTLHLQYWNVTRLNNPIHPQRSPKLYYVGENITSRSITNDIEEYNGISASKEFVAKPLDKMFVGWDGLEALKKDSWNFQLSSSSYISNIINKEPFKSFRSDSDTTSCVLAFDATDQGLQIIRADVAVFLNTNFRRCFIEGHTSSLLNAATTPSYRKEMFFDIDYGVITNDTTNYGESTVMMCHGKNWRIGEHQNRYIQFECCRLDSTAFRHAAFKILDNGPNFLNIQTGPNRFDTTSGMRYFIYDNKLSLALLDSTQNLNYWRIRIPENQSSNPATVSDETAQGMVYYERCREIGEFDIGKLSELTSDCDINIEESLISDVRPMQFENLTNHNIEFARPRKFKRIRYSNGTPENMTRLKKIFIDLHGSQKPMWVFDDQRSEPGIFIFGRIINEPEFEEINDLIQTVTIDVEEIS